MTLALTLREHAEFRFVAGRVGKTSLVLRYCKDTFSDKQVSTIQASYLTKRITLGSTACNLSIWVRVLALIVVFVHVLSHFTEAHTGHGWTRAVPCARADLLSRRGRCDPASELVN